jgi:hypothetical protein
VTFADDMALRDAWEGTGFADRPVVRAVVLFSRALEQPAVRDRSARRQSLIGVAGRVASPLTLRTPHSASRIKRDHRPTVFSTGGSPRQTILHSQDRSIPLLAAALNDESHWDTGTFTPRGSLSAISEAIHRADLPDPPHASMMRTHTRWV